jgi:phosphatidylserine/phosphatidylglycerophosphate/cardiolipin synthase-like enzyme
MKFNLFNPLKERDLKKFLICFIVTTLFNLSFFFSLSCPGVCQNSPTIEVLFSPDQGEEILRILIDTIRNAEERVYILIFSFTLDEIAEAIIEKHREGLEIKIIMDKGQGGSKWAVTEKLKQAGVPLIVKTGSKGGYMHIKALIADDTVLTGSYNYSKSATNRNDENFFIIKDKDILQAHLTKFNQLWGEELPAVSPEGKEKKERAPPCEITVYITKTGSKYHRSGCRYLRKSCIPISLTEAKRRGYAPCKVCKPPS